MGCRTEVESVRKSKKGKTFTEKLVVKIEDSWHLESYHRTSGNVFVYGSDSQAMRNYD